MTAAERYARAHELFQAIADLPPVERAALLEKHCGNDEALRRAVESLLEGDAQYDSIGELVLEIPPDFFPEAADQGIAGQHFGPYEVVREIGRGGLGAVYLAFRHDGEYRKEVAIKLIRRGLDTDDILQRFRTERQILAQLDHPNIARLIDGGTTEDGLPYFAMEFINGEPITTYCDSRRLGTDQRLDLFRKVCAGVSYAHQNLVVHRDLKPSNILVTAEDEPKLLDFGIAKLLTPDGETFTQTVPGLRVMTPDYASPEQIKGEKLTTTSDVYSLGVLLYELLTGQRPYRLKTRAPEEIARAITEQEPERPSTVAKRDGNPKTQSPNPKLLRDDLDTIVLMALRKEPARRYASVGQFSEDIRRHLEGRPVMAHRDTLAYRTAKFVRRNKIGVAAAVFVLLTLLGGIFATAWQAKRATAQARLAEEQARVASAERDRAQRESAKAQSINTFLQNILGFSDPTWLSGNLKGGARETTLAEAIDEAERRANAELADQPEVLAAVKFSIGRIYATRGRVDRSENLLRESLEIRRRVLGAEHFETVQSMSALGEQLNVAGKSVEAEALLRETVRLCRHARSKGTVEPKWFVIALNGLGGVQALNGETAEAELLFREALDAASNFVGRERAIIPILWNNLSVARSESGNVDGAITALEASLAEYRQSSEDLRFDSAVTITNLGTFLGLKGDYERAESRLREAIELFRATSGEENQKFTWAIIRLANLHYLRGEYREARESIDHVIAIQGRILSEGHRDFARSWLVLGKILTRTGETEAGESYLRKALELRNHSFSEGHWIIAEAQMVLGECLVEQTRYAEAEELLIASDAALNKKLTARDPRTQEGRRILVKLYEAWGKPEEAARYRVAPSPSR